MNPLMLLAMMGGLGGGGQAPTSSPPQDAPMFPAMMTGGGVTPNQDLMKSPLLAASAYKAKPHLGEQMPNEAVPSDSLLRTAYNVAQGPAGMSGWEQFGSFLKNMPVENRMMLGMSGLDGLLRALSGKL